MRTALASALALLLLAATLAFPAASADPIVECEPVIGYGEQVSRCTSYDPETERSCTSYRVILPAPLVAECSGGDGGTEACARGRCVPLWE